MIISLFIGCFFIIFTSNSYSDEYLQKDILNPYFSFSQKASLFLTKKKESLNTVNKLNEVMEKEYYSSTKKTESLIKRGEILFFLSLPIILLGYAGVLLLTNIAATSTTNLSSLGLEAIIGGSISAILISGIIVYIDKRTIKLNNIKKNEDLVYYFGLQTKI